MKYSEWMVEIQGVRSTYCMAAVPGLNDVHSGMLSASVKPLTIKDNHLASGARSFNPSAAKPPTMGSQMSSDKRWPLNIMCATAATSGMKPIPISSQTRSGTDNRTARNA